MGYKRQKKRKKDKNSQKLILPILMALSILWLITASIKDKSPTELLSDLYSWTLGRASTYHSKKDLHASINKKTFKIDSLNYEIKELINKSPYRTAIVKTEANSLNLRSRPNLSADVVIKIPDSSAVEVLYYNEEVLVLDGETGKWCKIKYADKEGWVWGNYLVLQN